MFCRFLGLFAAVGSLHAGTAAGQDASVVGTLLPRVEAPAPLRPLDGYAPGTPGRDPLAGSRAARSLSALERPVAPLRLRGAKEMAIFRNLASSVVLVLTADGTGSGSLISVVDGTGIVLTNWHVVDYATDVGIVFKPRDDMQPVTKADIVRGRVIKADPVRDLALIAVAAVPAHAVPLPLGTMGEVQIGADVHAIGHPATETWSYTKGLISQIRPGYQWQTDAGVQHRADVIQTQTPINPGNSGGPLIGDSGRMIGINSFKAQGEGLNFAVSVGEIDRFLAAAQKGEFDPKPAAARKETCKPQLLSEGRDAKLAAFVQYADFFCTGKANAMLVVPDDKSKEAWVSLDTNGDGEIDAVIYDPDRDGKWDISYWDTDFDGKPDLIGHHPDGSLLPSRTEKFRPGAAPGPPARGRR